MRNSTKSDEPSKGRGRPRAYDAETALAQAQAAFWRQGFSATSLDDLSAAMSMNRPSLYRAFGDKEALYLESLKRYRDASADAMRDILGKHPRLDQALRTIYQTALSSYLAAFESARGCLLIGTAAAEAVTNAAIRQALADSLAAFDDILTERFAAARKAGEIDAKSNPADLARLASAIMHSLAVRARAGDDAASLNRLIDTGVAAVSAMAGIAKGKAR